MDDADGRWRDESAAKLSEITPVEYTRPQVLPDATTEEASKEPYVFEGESFWDAAEDEHTPSNDLDYWGMAYDENAQQTYYFAFASGKTQWTPPSHLVYPESHQVLLWDDGAQWFYIYDYVHGSSRWLDHFEDLQERGSPQPMSDDCMSQATTEELELETLDDRRQQILASWDEATASQVLLWRRARLRLP
ncbi:hypothetical protein SPRG_11128 [Saprolegnia parasitica CBS 223.65]|uniref:WW domain-containing protein n=1 Tax=Saprolegnia parasitica (strain CBS 223.65) TaxID=695850 RepID=A0A067C3K8_SAPPC|nr:hypothetical protein SPRG_11128 [Saprolegnia parasitica CBS 223.65]KDO23680.1 hypothetical protein SPRG_11128 [Saprolegnia parasitica CBS 223.65]|eukprot:XP_012205663.1 hypothetical protein SPRG_11128 [Saprolegnia parasitica CBS 223.65]